MTLGRLEHEMVGFRSKAAALLLDHDALSEALREAWSSAEPHPPLQAKIAPLGRFVRAHMDGTYAAADPDAVVWALAALLYVASPWDLEPDYLPNGLRDDVLAATWVHHHIEEDVHAFREWEQDARKRR